MEQFTMCGYTIDTNTKYHPDGTTEETTIHVKAGPGFPVQGYRRKSAPMYDPALFQAARNFLRQKVILDNPWIQQDINHFRTTFLQMHGVNHSLEEWKIVGLTQRSGRRRWLNIRDAMLMCNNHFKKHKVLCMQVNVEESSYTPTVHIVVHGILDALIGIHGAQLTEAIWMKPYSLVVELLPYLPYSVSYGKWTRTVQAPSPLGVIYKGTDLYHMGVPLDWRSVPQCRHKLGNNFTECVRKQTWDTRNFAFPVEVLRDVLQHYVVGRPTNCSTQIQSAAPDRFVLYNALCDDGNGNGITNHYFYWNKSIEEYTQFNSVPTSFESNVSSSTNAQ
jgi:hypothetical protein